MKRLAFCGESGDLGGIERQVTSLFIRGETLGLPQFMAEDLAWQIYHVVRRFFLEPEPYDYDLRDAIADLAAYARDTAGFGQSLWTLLKDLLTSNASTGKKDGKVLFGQMDDFLRDNLSENLSMQAVCTRFGISQSYLGRLFRSTANTSFNEYVTLLRIRRAQEILREYPDIKMREVAEMVGYIDQHYFSRIFKSVVFKTPSEFRIVSNP